MPDLREVFEMVKQQTEPDLDSWSGREPSAFDRWHASGRPAPSRWSPRSSRWRRLGDEGTGQPWNRRRLGQRTSRASRRRSGLELALLDLATGTRPEPGSSPPARRSTLRRTVPRSRTSETGDVVYVANADGSNVHAFEQTDGPPGGAWRPVGPRTARRSCTRAREAVSRSGTSSSSMSRPGSSSRSRNLDPIPPASTTGAGASRQTVSRCCSQCQPTLLPAQTEADAVGHLVGPRRRWTAHARAAERGLRGYPTRWRPDHRLRRSTATGTPAACTSPGRMEVILESSSMARSRCPRWCPDGSQIGYSDDGENGMYVVDVATGETRQVSTAASGPSRSTRTR